MSVETIRAVENTAQYGFRNGVFALVTAAWTFGLFGFVEAEESGDQKGEPTAKVGLSLLAQEAFANNPRIKSARSQWKAAIERYPQAVALPDPMLGYGYFARSVETRVGPQRHRFGLKQKFPYPGKRRLKGEIVRKDVEIARLRYEATVRDVIVDLKTSFHELLYLEAAIEVTRQNQELLGHVLRIANAHYAEDKTSLNDVLRAQSQLGQLEYDLITLKELALTETTNLNALLSRPPETPLKPAAGLHFQELKTPLGSLYKRALEQRQEIQIARQKVERGDKAIDLAEKLNKPDFTVDLLYIETGSALMPTEDDGKDPLIIGFGVNIPIWGTRNRARVLEARHVRDAAAMSVRDLENKTQAMVKTIYFKLENSRRLVELYRDQLIPQAKKSVEISENWYRDGKGSFSDFLETQSVWLNFNLAYQRALADYAKNLARMEQVVGGRVGE